MISLLTEVNNLFNEYSHKKNYIFEACVTVNGRYYIIQDEIFDIKEQISLGNIWESLDKFKTIFQNTILNDDEYTQVRENILNQPILENQESLYGLRDILLEFNFFQDTWLGREAKKAGQGIKDFAVTSFEGLKKFGIAVSQGQWSEILGLLGKGVKYLLRKLKDALYSTIGMIVDAILVASGIGKSVQWIPWALVMALDIYQITTNDWPPEEQNNPMWMKYLSLGFDILGLVATGAAAKGARALFKPLLRATEMGPQATAKYLARNPKMIQVINSIINGISKVPGKLSAAQSMIASKFPAGAKFINSIMGKLSSILSNMSSTLKSLTGGATVAGKTTRAALGTTGILYGVDKYAQHKNQQQMNDLEQAIKATGVVPEFDINSI